MKQAIIGVVLLSLTAPLVASALLELKGYTIGSAFTREQRTTFSRCSSSASLGDYCFGTNVSLGNHNARNIMVLYKDDKVTGVSVSFSASAFEQIADAFILKYGKPTKVVESAVENRMGAKFRQMEMTWIGPDNDTQLQLTLRSTDLDTSSVQLSSMRAVNDFVRKKKEQNRKAAGNL